MSPAIDWDERHISATVALYDHRKTENRYQAEHQQLAEIKGRDVAATVKGSSSS